MRKLLVFQHVSAEPLGVLDKQLREHRFRIRFVNFSRDPQAQPDVRRYNGLIVLGGPMNTDMMDRHPNLEFEMRAIREAIDAGMPVLGICLGGQLIAKALGAKVGRSPEPEIGWYSVTPTEAGRQDPLFRHFSGSERIFQWHGDAFDIPKGGQRLAGSPGCPNQAFSYGENVYGLQFHLECDAQLIRRWLHTPSMCEELDHLSALGRVPNARETEAMTKRHIDRSLALAHDFFEEFIHRFHHRRRRVQLPSR